MRRQQDHLRSFADRAGGPGDEFLYGHGPAEGAGWFRVYFDGDRWEWSPQVERMHGYLPGTTAPTTELVLSHEHPDDHWRVADTMEQIRRTREPFSSRHRICDTGGQVRHVIVVGDAVLDADGTVIGSHGFCVDVTPTLAARRDEVTAALAEIAENRGAIEQAKGMLMAVYNLDADAAFNLLKWVSQRHNVKLRLLAEQIAADFSGLRRHGRAPSRSAYDHLLMTAHRRVAAHTGSGDLGARSAAHTGSGDLGARSAAALGRSGPDRRAP